MEKEMEVPPENLWLTFARVAKEIGVRPSTVHIARSRGMVSRNGERVSLLAWKTIRGWVTTREALDDFNRRLNF